MNKAVGTWVDTRNLRIDMQKIEHREFCTAHPLGGIVRWMKAGHVQEGIVEHHPSIWWHLHLRVKNLRTGKKVNVADYDIVEYLEKQK